MLNGKPFTFLDDAPLEERRTQAVAMRRGIDPSLIAEPEAAAIERVRQEVAPAPRDADELHDVLSWLVAMPAREEWRDWFSELAKRSRAKAIFVERADSVEDGKAQERSETMEQVLQVYWQQPQQNGKAQDQSETIELWHAAEMQNEVSALWPSAETESLGNHTAIDPAEAAVKLLRGHLDIAGPITATELAAATALPLSTARTALAELETQGYALRGNWEQATIAMAAADSSGTDADQAAAANGPTGPASRTPTAAETQWCSRRLLMRIHHYSKKKRRSQTEPVTAQDFMRFLLRWQHVAPGCQVRGTAGLRRVIEQLQGWELPAASWEEDILARRVASYTSGRLDELCMSGEVVWGRFSPSSSGRSNSSSRSNHSSNGSPRVGVAATSLPVRDRRSNRSGPSRATPITLAMRDDTDWLLAAIRGEETPELPEVGATAEILEALEAKGARFLPELAADIGRLPTDVENGLGDGIARGLLTADSFGALRSLLNRTRTHQRFKQYRPPIPNQMSRGRRRSWKSGTPRTSGRWALLPPPEAGGDPDELAELFAEQLLARWGVVFHDIFVLENSTIPWRDVLWALRRLEARGIVRGGRFVTGFTGEQFALPEAAADLRFVRRQPRNGQQITLNATDPLNLTGPILGTPRIPALRTRQITLRDGLPQPPAEASPEISDSLATESSYFSG